MTRRRDRRPARPAAWHGRGAALSNAAMALPVSPRTFSAGRPYPHDSQTMPSNEPGLRHLEELRGALDGGSL